MVALSSNTALPATVITAYICLSSLPHANLRWTFGPLGKMIVSPAYHRLHHATEGRIDVNLATVLTIWDVFTRRAVFPVSGSPPIATGLSSRQVPVEQAGFAHWPLGVLGLQLAEPFAPLRSPYAGAPRSAGGAGDRGPSTDRVSITYPTGS